MQGLIKGALFYEWFCGILSFSPWYPLFSGCQNTVLELNNFRWTLCSRWTLVLLLMSGLLDFRLIALNGLFMRRELLRVQLLHDSSLDWINLHL